MRKKYIASLLVICCLMLINGISFGNAHKNTCGFKEISELRTTVTSSHPSVGQTYHLLAFFPAKLKGKFNKSGFVWIEVAKFAFQRLIKQFEDAGFSINLDLIIYDSCEQSNVVTKQLLNEILKSQVDEFSNCCNTTLNNNIIGLIGPATSSLTDHVLKLLTIEYYPVVGYSATSIRFNDKKQYPTFLRTISPDNLQAQLMVELILNYNWTYVSVIAQDNEYGRMGMDELGKLLVKNGVCAAIEILFDPNDQESLLYTIERLKLETLSQVVILWATGASTSKFLRAADKVQLYHKVFIFTESLNENKDIILYNPKLVQGVFSIVPDAGIYHDFEEHFKKRTYSQQNPWLAYFFDNFINKNETHNKTTIGDHWAKLPMTKNGHIYNVINAYGKAIKNYISKNPECANTSICFKEIMDDRRDFFDNYLRKVVFKDLKGNPTTFDLEGNMNTTRFIISTPQYIEGRLQWKRIGDWNKNRGLHIHKKFFWPNNETAVPKSRCSDECNAGYRHHALKSCCWQCIPCRMNTIKPYVGKGSCTECQALEYANKERTECKALKKLHLKYDDAASVILISIATINTLAIISVSIVFINYRNTPIVISSQKTMSAIQMVFLALLNFHVMFSYENIDTKRCLLQGSLVPFVLTLAVAPTILKTQRLVTIFKAKNVLNRRGSVLRKDTLKVFLLLLFQSAIILFSLVFDSHAEVETIIDMDQKEIYVGCRFRLLLYMEICYLFIMFTVCGISAFKARELPTNYNETRLIAYAMFMCTIVMLFIFPLYESIANAISKRLVVQFVFLWIAFTVTFMLYVPKVWLILFRPNMNTISQFQQKRMQNIKTNLKITQRKRHSKLQQSSKDTNLAKSTITIVNNEVDT